MAEQPGDGGPGHSWFAIEVTSDPVPEPVPWPEPPTPQYVATGGSDVGGFTMPVVPRPLEFRFRGRLRGPRIEPFRAELSGSISAVKTFERIVSGKTHAVREVTFAVSGFREPAYQWAEALRDDDELLTILYAR